jgi:hypothetical protein
MPPISLRLRVETGETAAATGVFESYATGPRVAKSLGILLAGIGAGAALVVVPILHLVTTWALPLAGILGCLRIWRTHARVHSISGACPGCQEALQLEGGRAAFPLRVDCPACHRPLFIDAAEA